MNRQEGFGVAWCPCWGRFIPTSGMLQWQEALALDAQQFLVRNDPGAVLAASAAFLLGVNSVKATPFPYRKIRLVAEDFRHLISRIPVFDGLALDQHRDSRFIAFQAV